MRKSRALLLTAFGLLVALAAGLVFLQTHIPIVQAAAPPPAQAATAVPTPGQAPAAATQAPGDPAADRTSATIALQQDFVMDPYLLPVIGKGETPASDMVKGCNGYVSSVPNAVVNWTGKTDQLSFFVYSDGDPVLVIQQPDGSFICNDDAGLNTVQPLLVVKQPVDGTYKVYAGTTDKTQPALGFLGLSEADLNDAKLADLDLSVMLRHRPRPVVEALQSLDLGSLLADRAAIFGSSDLEPGFSPVHVFAAGGGDIAAFNVEDKKLTCAGFVGPVPSYSFTWSGKEQAIRLYFEALKDSSLAVVTPDQQVLCGTNSSNGNQNPTVDILKTQAGAYKVYVASMQPNAVVAGRLTITSDVKATPDTLAPAGQ